jgi:heavy metal translocating P-type ATPase
LSCAACAARVEKAVGVLPGVGGANVNLLKSTLSLDSDPTLTPEAVINAVEKAGYGATLAVGAKAKAGAPRNDPGDVFAKEAQSMLFRLKVSIAFAAPLFYLSMGHMFGWPLPGFFLDDRGLLPLAFTQFLLLIPVVGVNHKYFRNGFRNLAKRSPDMDSLIAVGAGAAALYGLVVLYRMMFLSGANDAHALHAAAMNLYFESGATILALVTVGKYLETRAKEKTGSAIRSLLALAPKTATISKDGEETTVPAEDLAVGDILVLKTGEVLAADGVVVSGEGAMDESPLTGESLPVDKEPGSKVTGACSLSSGHLRIKLTGVGEDTALAKIIRLVDEATSTKAPIARLADRISGVFVPFVIFVALASFAIWLLLGQSLSFSLSIMISVLVISCPCALGLATPTAIMVGSGVGARLGLLFKSAASLERTSLVKVMALDKTGTITLGKPELKKILTLGGLDEDEFLSTVYSVESYSEHPLAGAVAREAERRKLKAREVSSFKQLPGQGLSGTIDGTTYLVGNRRILSDLAGAAAGDRAERDEDVRSLLEESERLSNAGLTTLFLLKTGEGDDKAELSGLLALGDTLKDDAVAAVEVLGKLGIEPVMLTGDDPRAAEAVAAEAGIRKVVAGVRPEDKEKVLKDLGQSNTVTAMVGDGVNDAPALARADVGIAIGAGTEVAVEAGDVVLMKNELMGAPLSVMLSKKVMRNIRQNLFWAFGYNVLGIPIAAGVFHGPFGLTLNPMIAALAMSLSSVCVVSNALRLRFFDPDAELAKIGHLRGPAPKTEEKTLSGDSPKSESKTHDPPEEKDMEIKLKVDGMTCGHCSARVEKALGEVPGVKTAKVDLKAGTASVTTAGEVSPETLTKKVTDAGYEASVL